MKPIENPAYASLSPSQEKPPSNPTPSTNTGTNQGLPGSMAFTGSFQPTTGQQPATGTGQYSYYPYQYMMATGQQPTYMGSFGAGQMPAYGTTSMPGYMGSFGAGQMPAYLSNTNWSSTGTLPTQPKEQKSGDTSHTRNLSATAPHSDNAQKTNTLTKGNRPSKKGSSRKTRPTSQRPKDEAPKEPEPEPVPKKIKEPPKNLEHYVSISIYIILNYIY